VITDSLLSEYTRVTWTFFLTFVTYADAYADASRVRRVVVVRTYIVAGFLYVRAHRRVTCDDRRCNCITFCLCAAEAAIKTIFGTDASDAAVEWKDRCKCGVLIVSFYRQLHDSAYRVVI
jgi:hypothetical protein